MKRVIAVFLIVLVVPLLLMADSDNEMAPGIVKKNGKLFNEHGSKNPTEYMPWEVGQWAEYSVSEEYQDGISDEYNVRYVIVDKGIIDGEEYFTLEKSISGGRRDGRVEHVVRKPFRFLEDKSRDELREEFMPVKKYVRAGDGPIYEIDLQSTEELRERLGERKTTIDYNLKYILAPNTKQMVTPAGTFTTYHYHGDYRSGGQLPYRIHYMYDMYFSPEVPIFGIVYRSSEEVVKVKSAEARKSQDEELVSFGMSGGKPIMFGELEE